MKSKDLMVGDFVRVNRDGLCIKKNTIVEIRAIDGDNKLEEIGLVGSAGCMPKDKDQFFGGIWCDYLEPIPITQETLEKNFEKKVFYGMYDDFFDLEIREYYEGVYVVTYHYCEIPQTDQIVLVSFIHELQRAIRLFGIDKEIIP